MTGVGTRMIAAFAAAALAAASLTACGGSDSSTSGSSTATQSTSTAQHGKAKGGQAKQKGESESGEASGGSGSGEVSTPLKVSGGGSAQFRSKGGDNSIQEFGEESDESELEEAAAALHGFYVARAEEDWSGACAYLAKSIVQQLEQLASRSSGLKDKGCAAILKAFTRPLPASVRRETTVVDAASLRTEGEQSFLIYRGEGGAVYAMPMKQEADGWKVTLLAPTPLG